MRNELEYIPRGAPAVSWALGCVLVSYRERISMITGSLRSIPRWLLLLEMAVCLIPLTWLFIAILAMMVRGAMPLEVGILAGTAALLGPVGMVVTLKIVVLSRGSVTRTTATVMILLAAWTLLACITHVLGSGAPFSEWWRDLALIAVLPAWAAVHLQRIGTQRRVTSAQP